MIHPPDATPMYSPRERNDCRRLLDRIHLALSSSKHRRIERLKHRYFPESDHDQFRRMVRRAVTEGHHSARKAFDDGWPTDSEQFALLLVDEDGKDPLRPTPRCLVGSRRGSPLLVESTAAFREALSAIAPAFGGFLRSPFPEGVVAAGGAVIAAVQRPPFSVVTKGADVDLWIWGHTPGARRRALGEVVDALLSTVPDADVTVQNQVITFRAPSDGSTVQVVYTSWRTQHDVVLHFDMTYTQAIWDGRAVRATWMCVWALMTRTTFFCNSNVRSVEALRAKAFRKGFRVINRVVH